MIEIERAEGDEWMVTVKGTVTSHHRVRVTEQDIQRFGTGKSPEALIEESFRFLLDHEPNTSILPAFNLPLIGRYFPAYEKELQTRLRSKSGPPK
ncbi:MAG TPA: hypothetical protein VFE51_11915 [Verrucomicrobiae bacterium]|nr:hypothetical protein [Verrucomicrobiae bacterium]